MARELLDDQIHIAFAYALGGGVWRSNGFESIGPVGPYGTFGPELSFGRAFGRAQHPPFALAKWTHDAAGVLWLGERLAEAVQKQRPR